MRILILLALCAVPAFSAKLPYIVGGKDAQVGAYPWQASLQSWGSHICGASLISSNWLVTASHCIGGSTCCHPGSRSSYSVVLGQHDRVSRSQGSPVTYSLTQSIRHPQYRASGSYPNDIALLKTSKAVGMNKYVQTIRLPSSSDHFQGTSCVISGWGRYSQSSQSLPNNLQMAAVAVQSESYCKSKVSGWTGTHICIFGTSQDSACNGDSGGPLACQKSGQWYLVGAASFVFGNCMTSMPNVYTSTAYHRNWIKSTSGI